MLRVFRASWTLLDNTSYPHEVIEVLRGFYTRDRLQWILSNPDRRSLGAWKGKRLLGCLWGYYSAFDRTFSIDWVFVHPRLVHMGIFSRLMQTIERQMRRERALKISFFVSAKNIQAIKRYIKLGYSIEGIHRNHFFGWDFVSMGKILRRKRWRGAITKQPDFTEVLSEIRDGVV